MTTAERIQALIESTSLRAWLPPRLRHCNGMAAGASHIAYMLSPQCAIRLAAERLSTCTRLPEALTFLGREHRIVQAQRKSLKAAIAYLDTAAERMLMQEFPEAELSAEQRNQREQTESGYR